MPRFQISTTPNRLIHVVFKHQQQDLSNQHSLINSVPARDIREQFSILLSESGDGLVGIHIGFVNSNEIQ